MAIIRKYQSRVVSIERPVPGIFVVTLESLEKPFKFKSGQFLHLALDPYDPSKAWPDSRCFSIQTSPDDPCLKLTYSVKGNFTSRMASELMKGNEVCLKLAYGDLFQKPHNKKKCVFIAGGTGITPYLSLFTSRDFEEYKNPKLYFGIRNLSYNIYQDELTKSSQINDSLEITIIDQKEEGMLDIESIFSDNGIEPCYFISGPPEMIGKFKMALLNKEVKEENIITDDWE